MPPPDRFDQKTVVEFLRQPPAVEQSLKQFLSDVRQRLQQIIGNLTIPGPPSGLTVVADGNTIRLNWNSSFSAHSYHILRGTTRVASAATTIAVIMAPQRIFHDPIVSATPLFYWVKALNSISQESPLSAMVTITPILQDYTVTNLTTDRSYDADTVLVAELADIVGTLITDLQARGILQ